MCGSIAGELRAHGHVSPWSPDGSAPKTARAFYARIWSQTARVDSSDSKNDSACNGKYGYDATCCAASCQPFSAAECRSKMGAKSISMEKWDFFNLISGSVLFLYSWRNCKKPGSFLIKDGLLFSDLSKIWIKPELEQIAGARLYLNRFVIRCVQTRYEIQRK